MNIVQIVNNKVWGGGERYVLDLCRALEGCGHSVAVITRGKDAVDSKFRDAGFFPGRLPLGGLFDFISTGRLAAVMDRMDAPVVLHVHNFKMARLAVAARHLMKSPEKVRIIVTRHLARPAKTDKASLQLYTAVDAIVFVSELAKEEFLSSAPAVDASKLHVVRNAVVRPTDTQAEDKPAGEFRLVYTGRICAEKGLNILFKALAQLDDLQNLRLHLVGTGSTHDIERLARMAATLGISDKIVWRSHLDNVWPVILSADAGVLPSIVKEAISLSILEFIGAGCPVVSTNAGGQGEVIIDGINGFLVPVGDADALATAIRRIASDKGLRERMAAAAAEKAVDMNYESFFEKILGIYCGK